jgi:hypothetical protein
MARPQIGSARMSPRAPDRVRATLQWCQPRLPMKQRGPNTSRPAARDTPITGSEHRPPHLSSSAVASWNDARSPVQPPLSRQAWVTR